MDRGMGKDAVQFVLKNKYIEVLNKIISMASDMGYYAHDGDTAEVAERLGFTVAFPASK